MEIASWTLWRGEKYTTGYDPYGLVYDDGDLFLIGQGPLSRAIQVPPQGSDHYPLRPLMVYSGPGQGLELLVAAKGVPDHVRSVKPGHRRCTHERGDRTARKPASGRLRDRP